MSAATVEVRFIATLLRVFFLQVARDFGKWAKRPVRLGAHPGELLHLRPNPAVIAAPLTPSRLGLKLDLKGITI